MIMACACMSPGLFLLHQNNHSGFCIYFFSKTSLVCRATAPRVYGSSSNADDGVVMRAYLCACQVEQLQLCIYFPSTWATFVPLRLALLAARSTIMSMLKDPTWTHAIRCLCGLAQVLYPRMEHTLPTWTPTFKSVTDVVTDGDVLICRRGRRR